MNHDKVRTRFIGIAEAANEASKVSHTHPKPKKVFRNHLGEIKRHITKIEKQMNKKTKVKDLSANLA